MSVLAAACTWAQRVTGATPFVAGQNKPAPPVPYVAVRMTVPANVGRDEVRVREANGGPVATVSGPRTARLTLDVHGEARGDERDAHSLVAKLCALTHAPSTQEAFASAGAAIARVEAPAELSFTVGSRLHTRVALDVHLNLTSQATEAGTYIQTVELDSPLMAGAVVVSLGGE